MKFPSRAFATTLAATLLGACFIAAAPASAAMPKWAPIAASGPTNLPPVQSEVQRVAVDAEGGTYELNEEVVQGSGTLTVPSGFGNYASGGTTITVFGSAASLGFAIGQTIVSAPNVPAGTTITGVSDATLTLSNPTTGEGSFVQVKAASKTVTAVTASSGAFAAGQTISATGIPAGTTITAVGAGTLTLSAFPTEGGAKALTVIATTAPIDFDAGASGVEAALVAAGIPVTVAGGPGDKGATKPYFLTFGGGFADRDVPQVAADSTGLSGGDNHVALTSTKVQGGPGTAEIAIYVQNVGGAPSAGATSLEVTLPANVKTTATPTGNSQESPVWNCTQGAGQSSVECVAPTFAAQPGFTIPPLSVPVGTEPGAESGIVHIEVSGGGTVGIETYEMPLVVSALSSPPGLQAVSAGAYDEDGLIDARAGAHPYSGSAGILVNTIRSARTGEVVPAGEFRDIVVDTPPGFLGNPIAAAQCAESLGQPQHALPSEAECAQDSIVATAQVSLGFGQSGEISTVNNIEAPYGYPAKFRFLTGLRQVIVNVAASLRSEEDYGLTAGSYDTPQIKPVYGSFFTFWGSPADPGHDSQRCKVFLNTGAASECAPGGEAVAFLTSPVDCAEEAIRPPVARINVNTWQSPGLWFTNNVPIEPVTGCDELDFEVDDFEFSPTSAKAADSPASFKTEIEMPTAGLIDPDGRMNPTIRESVIDMPEGVALNASAADGLGACSFDQIGFKGKNFPRPNEIRFDKKPSQCPPASKIGTGELKSELLADPLAADLYLAEQGSKNPFGSLFAIYLVIENPRNGIFIKLPGEVQVNQKTGKQKITFRDLPPLPFTYLKLNLKGGPRSPLATPVVCGSYSPTMTNTPWSAPESGPPLQTPFSFDLDQGPNGTGCVSDPAKRPFNVKLNAGTDSVTAGAFSPLSFQITRPDGSQEIDTLQLKLPSGLAASLKGIPYCPEAQIGAIKSRSGKAEQQSPACPQASRLGRTLAGAGSGPSPFYAPGQLYLAGPYKGAPLSVLAVTPAVAGPFDLGNVVVRNAIEVDPVTAQVNAKADPIPQILEGVPLRVKDIRVILDRSGFALNPTDCSEKQIGAHITGNSGASADLSTRFQVGGCENLPFRPSVDIRLFGGTARAKYQGVRAVVRPRPGDANISGAVVKFPTSAFVAQEHLSNICTRVQWAADACPKSSIYGHAEAITPLLDEPLKGTVHLRSSSNLLPDLVADLRGPANQPIKVEVAIKTDAVKGALRSTVMTAPDAPVTLFRLQTFGGNKGLIVNSRNICRGKNAARATFRAHNGRRFTQVVPVRNARCAKQRKAAKRKALIKKRRAAAKRAAAGNRRG